MRNYYEKKQNIWNFGLTVLFALLLLNMFSCNPQALKTFEDDFKNTGDCVAEHSYCADITCTTSICWNGCTYIPGEKECSGACTPTHSSCANIICTTSTCWDGCTNIPGTKVAGCCIPTNPGCAFATCKGTQCNDGCGNIYDGLKETGICASADSLIDSFMVPYFTSPGSQDDGNYYTSVRIFNKSTNSARMQVDVFLQVLEDGVPSYSTVKLDIGPVDVPPNQTKTISSKDIYNMVVSAGDSTFAANLYTRNFSARFKTVEHNGVKVQIKDIFPTASRNMLVTPKSSIYEPIKKYSDNGRLETSIFVPQFTNVNPLYTSTFILITNTSDKSARVTYSAQTDSGEKASGTLIDIPANSMKNFNMTSIIEKSPNLTGKTVAIQFNINKPEKYISFFAIRKNQKDNTPPVGAANVQSYTESRKNAHFVVPFMTAGIAPDYQTYIRISNTNTIKATFTVSIFSRDRGLIKENVSLSGFPEILPGTNIVLNTSIIIENAGFTPIEKDSVMQENAVFVRFNFNIVDGIFPMAVRKHYHSDIKRSGICMLPISKHGPNGTSNDIGFTGIVPYMLNLNETNITKQNFVIVSNVSNTAGSIIADVYSDTGAFCKNINLGNLQARTSVTLNPVVIGDSISTGVGSCNKSIIQATNFTLVFRISDVLKKNISVFAAMKDISGTDGTSTISVYDENGNLVW